MDNQHKLIKGYRDLSQEEIDAMNEIKSVGTDIDELLNSITSIPFVDQRWVDEARMDLQKGVMCLVRAVAKPNSF